MKKPTRVSFFLMRHPKHVDDVVTAEGEAQIVAAAKKHLSQVAPFRLAFCTEKKRARRTAELALEAIGQYELANRVKEERDLGFQYAEDEMEEKHPFSPAVDKIVDLRKAGQFVSVKRVCEEIWPPGMVIRHTMRATLRQLAKRLADPGQTVRVLVGNHGTNVYATPNPAETDGYPPNCAIARYDWVVDESGEASLESFELLLLS